jgi:hypothetical protein
MNTNSVEKPTILPYKRHLLVCTGSRCAEDGAAQALFDSLGDKFKAADVHDGAMRVKRSRVSCFAACKARQYGPHHCAASGRWHSRGRPGVSPRPGERPGLSLHRIPNSTQKDTQ